MLGRLKARARSLSTRRRLDLDMDEEMRFHIEQYQRDLVRSGVPPSEASRRARQAFGNISLVKECAVKRKDSLCWMNLFATLSTRFVNCGGRQDSPQPSL